MYVWYVSWKWEIANHHIKIIMNLYLYVMLRACVYTDVMSYGFFVNNKRCDHKHPHPHTHLFSCANALAMYVIPPTWWFWWRCSRDRSSMRRFPLICTQKIISAGEYKHIIFRFIYLQKRTSDGWLPIWWFHIYALTESRFFVFPATYKKHTHKQ